ncbi:MAG: hypothetical protein AAB447_01555 [Patescibacteria group bacterium]
MTPAEAHMEGIQRKTDAMLAQIQQMTNLVEGTLEVALDYSTESEIFRAKIRDIRWGKGLPIFTIENPIEWDQKIGIWKPAQLSPEELVSHTVVDISDGRMWMVTPFINHEDNVVVFLLCHMSSPRVPSRFLISPAGSLPRKEPWFGRTDNLDKDSPELVGI